jgi:hypothetical protein
MNALSPRNLAGHHDSESHPGKRRTVCVNCGEPFRAKRRTRQFCSDRCRKAHSRALPTSSITADVLRHHSEGQSVFSSPVNLLGGSLHRWPGAPLLDRELRRGILDIELGFVAADDDCNIEG